MTKNPLTYLLTDILTYLSSGLTTGHFQGKGEPHVKCFITQHKTPKFHFNLTPKPS
jgi:hypothetical protein